MTIRYYTKADPKYFDRNGEEILEGDLVIMDGKIKKVYRTEDGYLGTDATNPKWIEIGRACECEYGVYPFEETDDPVMWYQFNGEGVKA